MARSTHVFEISIIPSVIHENIKIKIKIFKIKTLRMWLQSKQHNKHMYTVCEHGQMRIDEMDFSDSHGRTQNLH